MIIGVGVDLIEIERVKNACAKQHFLMRCFSVEEQKIIGDDYTRAAGNWAVKEAVSKAFGTGIHGFELTEIEVLRKDNGRPYIELQGNAKDTAKRLEITDLHVSISNTKDYAIAYVTAENRKE